MKSEGGSGKLEVVGPNRESGFDVEPAKVLSYKDELRLANERLAEDPLVCFIGYGVRIGGRAGGTLKNVPDSQLIEMPVAESLMLSFAIGLALKGRRPVVYFERMDFILNAMDAMVNHLNKIEEISREEFAPTVLIRALVGGTKKPLYTGATHVQDFSEGIRKMVSFPVVQLTRPEQIAPTYAECHQLLSGQVGSRCRESSLLVEYKDLL